MNADTIASDFFVAGGTLRPDSPSYIKRVADDDLFGLAMAGKFCYALTARQMGKSSLMARTAKRLKEQGVRTAIIDLTQIGTVAAEQWYLGLLTRLTAELRLAVNPQVWWEERSSLGAVQRFTDFVRQVVLQKVEGRIVVFVDEVDSTLRLDFADDFFAAIRSMYNARASDPAFNRLAFVLFGVATPSDLIKDRTRTPFNIGQGIDLHEFTRQDAQALEQELEAIYPEQGGAIFDRIFYWTNGHPYLTQKLCLAVTESRETNWNDEQIDKLVEKLFLSEEARKETNLQFVRNSVASSSQRGRLLRLYRKVYEGKSVPEDERSLDQNRLKLFGLVRTEKGLLKVRNEIYRRAFDSNWIRANTPVDWTFRFAVSSIVLSLLLIAVTVYFVYRQTQQATDVQIQLLVKNFKSTNSADVRITNLADLFDVSEEQARQLFNELTPSEQIALFSPADPKPVADQFINVVKQVGPDLGNWDQGNTLLSAMASSLRKIDWAEANSLRAEIEQWLRGRTAYNQGQYEQAVQEYDFAIRLDDRNPGTVFDRGLAYARQGKTAEALADMERVLSIKSDPVWQLRVQQAIVGDSRLYSAAWKDKENYKAVAALIPTATATPLPSATPRLTATVQPQSSPTTVLAQTQNRVRPQDKMRMILVPAGEFLMGSNTAPSDEKSWPQHLVYLDPFWIDETEVTNAQYRLCRQDKACGAQPSSHADDPKLNGDDQPVVGVDWNDANAYCKWVGGQLPAEAQWEKAARGTNGFIYPWGDKPASCEYAVMNEGGGNGCGQGEVAWPIGSKLAGASPYGVLDMAGNVWEWVADWYAGYSSEQQGNPLGPTTGTVKVQRGGSWGSVALYVTTTYRAYAPVAYRHPGLGFRCAMSQSLKQ
jgi:formylglycine-generating enzyme required for sulfatase activity